MCTLNLRLRNPQPGRGVRGRIAALLLGGLVAACGGGGDAAAPRFDIQPLDLRVVAGESYGFLARPAPASALVQWRRNGAGLAGATGPLLSGYATEADDGARFDAVATLDGASVNSSPAVLRVSRWQVGDLATGANPYPATSTAVAAGGQAWAAWCEQRAGGLRVLVTRYRDGDGRAWRDPEGVGVDCIGVQDLAADADGNAFLAWKEFNEASAEYRVSMKRFDAASRRWLPANTIGPAPGRTVHGLRVVAAGHAEAAVAYSRFGGGSNDLQLVRHHAGSWTGADRLAVFPSAGLPAGGLDDCCTLDIAPDGDIRIAWAAGEGGQYTINLQRLRAADLTLELPQVLQRSADRLSQPRFARRGGTLELAWAARGAAGLELRAAATDGSAWSAVRATANVLRAGESASGGALRLLWFAASDCGSASAAIEDHDPAGRYLHVELLRACDTGWRRDEPSSASALDGTVTDASLFGLAAAGAEPGDVIASAWVLPGDVASVLHTRRIRPLDGWSGGVSADRLSGRIRAFGHAVAAGGRALIAWTGADGSEHFRLLEPVS